MFMAITMLYTSQVCYFKAENATMYYIIFSRIIWVIFFLVYIIELSDLKSGIIVRIFTFTTVTVKITENLKISHFIMFSMWINLVMANMQKIK